MHQFVTDSGHGWLQIPVSAYMDAVHDGVKISSYSYADMRTGYVYLEEDMDAPSYMKWYERVHKERLQYEEQHHDGDCFVRNLPMLIAQN